MNITLATHDCYPPTLFVLDFNKDYGHFYSHVDKNNVKYWRAKYLVQQGEYIGFIVREDFYKKYKYHEIAQMQIEIYEEPKIDASKKTTKSIKVLSYSTFNELKKAENLKFIEIEGVYFSGVYLMNTEEKSEQEKIFFVPSEPNKFSFYQYDTRYLCSNIDYRVRLIRFTKKEVERLLYEESMWWVLNQEFYHVILVKNTLELDKEYGSESVEEETNALVFPSISEFTEAVVKTGLSTQEDLIKISDSLNILLAEISKEIPYLKRLKSLIKSKIQGLLKIEYNSEAMKIDKKNKHFGEIFDNIKGYPYSKYKIIKEENVIEKVTLDSGLATEFSESCNGEYSLSIDFENYSSREQKNYQVSLVVQL